MTPSNCPYCKAPLPATRPEATRPVILCQSCGKAIVTAASVAGSPAVSKPASPAKTLMWMGGPLPGRPGVPPVAPVPSRPGTPSPAMPISPTSAPAVTPRDANSAAGRVPAMVQSAASPAGAEPRGASALPAAVGVAAAPKRRTATSEFATAPTIVPPPPEPVDVAARHPEPLAIDANAPDSGGVDVDMSAEGGPPSAGGAAAVAEAPSGEPASEAGAMPTPENKQPDERASDRGLQGDEVSGASDAVPEWAGSAPSVGLVASLKGTSGGGRRKVLLAAGGVGVLVLVASGVAVFVGGGKKQSAPEQQRAPVKAIIEADKAAVPSPPATGEKPALPAAAAEPAKPQPAAVEKPAQPANPVPAPTLVPEKPRPVEKKVVAEPPAPAASPVPQNPLAAPKPAVEKPVTEKVRTASEPATPKPEKKLAEVAPPAAKPAGNKAQEAAEAYQRGNAKLLSGALPEAIAAFSEAVKLNPKDAQSQRGLGLAYAQSGNAAQAVRHLRLYLKASPNAPDRALMEKRIDQLGGR